MKQYKSNLLTLELNEITGAFAIFFNNKRILESENLFCINWEESDSCSLESRQMHVEVTAQDNGFVLLWSANGQEVSTQIKAVDNRLEFYAEVTLSHGYLTKMHYPILKSVSSIGDAPSDDSMIIPWQNGFVVNNPAKNLIARESKPDFWAGRGGKKYENDYPAQFSFQFLYWYGPQGGVYLCTEDGEARFKSYGLYSINEETFSMTVIHYPENSGSIKQYTIPYPVVIKGLDGDWQDAAQEYRRFAIRQKWCCKGKLKKRDILQKLYDVDLWRINHQHQEVGKNYKEYFKTSLKLQQVCEANLGLHWYGWNQTPHDTNYPVYIRSGEKDAVSNQIIKANDEFKHHNIIKIPYVNARLVDQNGEDYTKLGADDFLIQNESGQAPNEPWNTVSKMVPMCPATDFWQDMVRNFCTDYFKLGFDGFYLDQIGSYFATRCYSKAHGHPLGGGDYWNTGYHRLINKVRSSIGEDTIITTESCCETYIDAVDMLLIFEQDMLLSGIPILGGMSNQQSVPLFNMIYGDYSLSYGTSNHFDIPYEIFSYILVRNLLWGFIPTIEGVTPEQLQKPDAACRLNFLKDVVSFYRYHKSDFFFGRLKRIPKVIGKTIQITLPCLINGSYTLELPALICSIWEGEDDHNRLFSFNLSEKENEFIIDNKKILINHGFFSIENW